MFLIIIDLCEKLENGGRQTEDDNGVPLVSTCDVAWRVKFDIQGLFQSQTIRKRFEMSDVSR